MSAQKKTPTGDESVGANDQQAEEAGMTTHGKDHAASRSDAKPSIDAESLLRAGLTLIPLHRWDARDAKGRARGKSPIDGAWQSRDYDSREVLAQAERRGLNVGVRLPPSWMVLDVDPRNFPEGRDPLAELAADARLDLDACPHGHTGSGGHHYWFRKPADVQVLDSLEDYPGVEFKSHGRQVVAPGSIHPNGNVYRWDDLAPFPEEAPQVPDTLLRLIRRPTRAHGEAAGLGELTPEMLAETLEQLDPEDFREHGDWLNLMMACHHATDGEGRQEFIDWSTQDPDYQDDAWIIGRRWDSLHSTASRGGRPITVKYLHKVVQAAGGEVARAEPEDDFDAWEDPAELGQGVDDSTLRQPPKAQGVDAVIEEMNARHYVVMEGGKFRIVTEEADPVLDGRTIYQRSTKEDFENLYCNQLVEKGDKLVSRSSLWLRHPHRRQYKGVVFDPERDHEGWLNLWKGWSVEPRKGDWSLLRELIRDVLTDSDAESFEYVLNWIAHMVQRPGRPAEVALAFRGDKGTGKGTLGRALAELAGASGLHIANPSQLVGRFNSHLQNCILLFADEAFWAGDKAGESVLKALVTEPTITYEGKGRDAVSGKNLIHIVMASNSDWVVPAGLGDERRFAVFEVNGSRRGDKAFFDALNAQLYGDDRAGLAAFLHEMLTRNIEGWAPRDSVPQTRALEEQKLRGLDIQQEWWLSLLQSGDRPYDGTDHKGDWAEREVRVLCESVHSSYRDYARAKGRQWLAPDQLGRVLKTYGVRRCQLGSGELRGKMAYVLPALGQALATFSELTGIPMKRLQGD